MNEKSNAECSQKRQISPSSEQQPLPKKARGQTEQLPNSLADDWKLHMGASLAERLERIAVERKLTISQVKRLLKHVLTNEDVVAAFKHFMNGALALLEPETGEPSLATRRQAHILGFDTAAFSRYTTSTLSLEDPISRRVLTRSVARKLRVSEKVTIKAKNAKLRGPQTFNEMVFPDESGDEEASQVGADLDYQPTAVDWEVFARDLTYDDYAEDCEQEAEASVALDDSQSEHTGLPSVDESQSPRCYHTRSCRQVVGSKSPLESPSSSPVKVGEDEKDDLVASLCFAPEARGQHFNETAFASHRLPEGPIVNDQDDQIYTSFLRSLFSPGPEDSLFTNPYGDVEEPIFSSTKSDPDFGTTESRAAGASPMLGQTVIDRCRVSMDDIADDPDFDVMAEIEDVCREDLLDELRNDRAVRVSKIEAKELRRELNQIFSMNDEHEFDDDEDDEDGEPFESPKEGVSGQLEHRSIDPFVPALPVSISPDVQNRINRQLSMHAQLLASNYVSCINDPGLLKLVSEPIREQVLQLTDIILGKPDKFGSDLCIQLHETHRFVQEFAGLSCLPRISATERQSMSTGLLCPRLLPCPFFLLDFITRSPVWPYANLLPPGLPSAPAVRSAPPKRKKLFSVDAEDNLFLLSVANIAEYSPRLWTTFVKRCRAKAVAAAAAASGLNSPHTRVSFPRSQVFKLTATSLLPTRTPRQIWSRKRYLDLLARLHGGYKSRKIFGQHPLLSLLTDLQSPQSEFPDITRLRSAVSEIARSTRASQIAFAKGSLFSRPDTWPSLPPSYQACVQALRLQQNVLHLTSSKPAPECLSFCFRGLSSIEFFFNYALLCWWPSIPMTGFEESLRSVTAVDSAFEKQAATVCPMGNLVLLQVCHQAPIFHPVPSPVQVQSGSIAVRPPVPSAGMTVLTPAPSAWSASVTEDSLRSSVASVSSKCVSSETNHVKIAPRRTKLPIPRLPPPPPQPPASSVRLQSQSQQRRVPAASPTTEQCSAPPLVDVGHILQAFYTGLDRVLLASGPSGARSAIPSATRFLRRCRVKGCAPLSDDLTLQLFRRLPNPGNGKEADEADVRSARSLLDRCRAYLLPDAYAELVAAFAELARNTDIAPEVKLAGILHRLSPSRVLWEDFVALLTPTQARRLRVFPVYAHLVGIRQLQQTLTCLVPPGKRLWYRMRKLADLREAEEAQQPVTTAAALTSSSVSVPAGCRRRGRWLKPRPARDVWRSTWSLLEASFRDRHALLAQMVACLDPSQRPYSNFYQAFEVTDALARKPDTCVPVLDQSPTPLPRLVDKLREGELDEFAWEVSYDLASLSPPSSAFVGQTSTSLFERRVSKTSTARQCACPCHDIRSAVATTASLVPVAPVSGTKSTAKVDSLGLRHCINCSLRVHRGVVYVDECNFHLAHVQITWPPGFSIDDSKVKRHLPSISSAPLAAGSVSTRLALEALANYQNKVSFPMTDEVVPQLPDMARRQVTLRFRRIPASPIASSGVPPLTTTVPEKIALPSVLPIDDQDDDAACFNTEAFVRSPPILEAATVSAATGSRQRPWILSEDRRLLEYCRASGCSSRSQFNRLALVWPERTLDEIKERFKYLMHIALGEEYNSDAFDSASSETSLDGCNVSSS